MDDAAADLAPAIEAQVENTEPARQFSSKDGDVFLVADRQGDICGGAAGLFVDDMRYLSRYRLLIGERRPSPLSCGLSADGALFTFHGTNLALPPIGRRATPRGVIHVERRRVLNRRRMFERIRFTNFGHDEVMLPIAVEHEADFADMFEVRGMKRTLRGEIQPSTTNGRSVLFSYAGLDDKARQCCLTFSEPPWRQDAKRADFMLTVMPGAAVDLYVEAGETTDHPPTAHRFETSVSEAREAVKGREQRGAHVHCLDGAFAQWLAQSRSDVALLTTDLKTGPYPYAGIPWFSTPFGRDGIITAWSMLWLDPSLARGVLAYLGVRQATELSDFRDSAPGKIMHETRRGEMAAIGEVPFGVYYGGVDTTPLFVFLAGAYLERTGDLEFIRHLWPALRAATGWLETYADSNGDGLIDYARGADTGLSNQGWKDSEDSVFHADGRFPSSPVALVEVQGYAFAAWRAMAAMATRLGEPGAEAWAARAEALRQAVEDRFWMEDLGYYGIALDGAGELCRVLTSNAGHLLMVGLPSPERAERVTRRLLAPGLNSGWGLRTLAKGQVRFNPMSYHNGSIWPHDTAICVMGMAEYGEREGVAGLLSDLFDAAHHFEMRMPELFCGFQRDPDEPPIAYPVACLPQAWSAASAFLMLQACLGLQISAEERRIQLFRPTLPVGVDQMTIEGLEVAGARVDLVFRRVDGAILVTPGPNSDRSVSIVLVG
jgi:glycogen debranching enzyme